ncbi:MAG: sigma-54 dependent transcriptional regulator [bacterium]
MTARHTLLIVDDDKNTREGLRRALLPSYAVLLAESAERALPILDESEVDIVLCDIRMSGMDGLALLQRIAARSHPPIVIMLTAYGNVATAVEAMKRGAYDFLMKPVNLDHLDMLIKRALRSRDVESENRSLREQLDTRFGLENIVGQSDPMQEVFDIIRQAAPTQATILLQGESGTGKELVAHAFHRLSPRAKGPFVAVHCAALSPTLLESELFGHEKGAFTGATERRRGRFELADGGTLFLDEISEIPPSVQVKLLRVLEERKFERVGGHETLDVDIRLIAATNADLRKRVEEGQFRSDLFFRLDVVSVTLPPLRTRLDDIPLLCSHFIKDLNVRNGKEVAEISPESLAVLSAYPWPGNVRELRNVLERMVVLSRGTRLTLRDIPANLRHSMGVTPGTQPAWRNDAGRAATPESMQDAERVMIERALKKFEGNRTRAAEQLGISRRTLQRKLKEYSQTDAGITPPPGTAISAAS